MSTKRQSRRGTPVLLVLASVLMAVASLGAVIQAYAMPVEARQTEAWYSYQSNVAVNYAANVKQGTYYPNAVMKPEDLVSLKLPVEPPIYHRVLLTKYTDNIAVRVPYSFRADRPAETRATLRIDGAIVAPSLWRKANPLLPEKKLEINGTEISGEETFVFKIKDLLVYAEAARDQMNMVLEPIELHVTPVLHVEVAGLRQPVTLDNTLEFVISVRGTTVEIDDVKQSASDKTFTETRVLPVQVSLFGREVPVATLRTVSLYSLTGCLLLAGALVLLRRKKKGSRSVLQRLGSNVISVRSFDLTGVTAMAEVRSARELMQLHVQTERPVVRAGNIYYILDGTTCYRYTYSPEDEQSEAGD